MIFNICNSSDSRAHYILPVIGDHSRGLTVDSVAASSPVTTGGNIAMAMRALIAGFFGGASKKWRAFPSNYIASADYLPHSSGLAPSRCCNPCTV